MKQIINAYMAMLNESKQIQPSQQVNRLDETTVPEHLQHVPDQWDHHSKLSEDTQEKIGDAMKHGSFTHFPLNETRNDIDPDLAEHLSSHGYTIKDYSKGTVSKKLHAGDPTREKVVDSDIMSVLNKTKASPQIISDYAKSKKNVSDNKAGLHVVVSTSPLAIAGMTTGTHWKNTSCMNMEGGAYHHKLRDDSENGTHVAFLVPHDDPTAFKYGEPSNPLARIALKAYHEDPYEGHDSDTVFRPENKTYGSGSSSFTSAVAQWASANYPAKADVTYHKNEDVYDDTNEREFTSVSPQSAKRAIDAPIHAHIVPKQGMSIDHHVIESAMDHGMKKFELNKDDSVATKREKYIGAHDFATKMSEIGNLNAEHVSRLNRLLATHDADPENDPLQRNSNGQYNLAVRHGDKFSTKAIRNYHDTIASKLQTQFSTEDAVSHIPNKMLMSPKLPDEYVDRLRPDKYALVNNQKIKPHHVDKLVDSYLNEESGSYYTMRDMQHHLNANHLLKLASNPHSAIHTSTMIINHPEFNKDHHTLLVKNTIAKENNQLGIRNILNNSKYATLDDALKSHNKDAIYQLAHNENLPEDEAKRVKNEIVKRVANAPDSDGVQYMNRIPGLGGGIKSHISKHFTDDDYDTLAKKNINFELYDNDHSNKYLDKLQEHIGHLDDALGEAHESGDDDQIEHHTEKLHGKIETLANNIEDHIKLHVMDDDNDDYVKDESEADKTLGRIEHIRDDLANYTGTDENRYENTEHYDENLAHIHEKLNDAIGYTQNRLYHEDW